MKSTKARIVDNVVRGGLGILSLAPLLIVCVLAGYLSWSAWPVFRYMGWHFFTDPLWSLGNLYAAHPVTVHGVQVMPGASFGALVFIVGTVLTAGLALIIAVPVALGVAAGSAFFIHGRIRPWAAGLVEMMAGIPSVLYGLWGLTEVAPFVSHRLGPILNRLLSPLPFVSGPIASQTNLFVAVIVITLMIVPIMAATMRTVMEQIPPELIASGLALGWTEGETFWHVVWPFARPAVIGGSILGLGRALGETMAVLMVSGDALNILPHNLYSAISTMAATIAGQLDSALTDPTQMGVHALGALGFVLFLITIIVNVLARGIVRRAALRINAWNEEDVLP